jgi:alcohol dehydrogenase (cytochrome c)
MKHCCRWRILIVVLACTSISSVARARAHHPEQEPSALGHSVAGMSAAKGSAPPVAQAVSSERLARARSEPQNWLTYYGAYDGQRYSTLDQINIENVKGLKPAWVFQYGTIGLQATPATYSFEASPLVVDGVMYVAGWDGLVWAFDAATGELLWQYKHAIPLDAPLCCGNVNRGVAVANGKVFVATANGHLLALDGVHGKRVWETVWCDVRAGESATLAPLVVKNMVLVGSSGAEYGVRGHIDAFNSETGKRIWRRYTVPKPGEPGSETWDKSSSWSRGGGTAWITGSYDPELNLVYWGTGNPGPDFDDTERPGRNLFTCSVLAFRPEDGNIKWHYQWTPHDVWDYDGVNENILFDMDGRKVLAHFDKNGYLFVLDRQTGQFVRASRFAQATWGNIDPGNGKVVVQKSPTREGVEIQPGPAGGKEWPHAAYSPRTGLLYVPVIEATGLFKSTRIEFREGLSYWGGEAKVVGEHWGAVKAIDPKSGNEVWLAKNAHPMLASVLATAGDVIFTGKPTGEAVAFNAKTGELLWQFQTGSGIHSSPSTYSVNGKQYVAIPSGWGGWIEGFAPGLFGGSRGNALFVFALP